MSDNPAKPIDRGDQARAASSQACARARAEMAGRFRDFNTDHMQRDDVLALIEEARAVCPVPWSDEKGGHFIFMNHADVRRGLRDWRDFSNEPSTLRPLRADSIKVGPSERNPPDSTFYRSLMVAGVNHVASREAEPLVRADVVRCLEAMVAKGGGDLVPELGNIIPVAAIFHVLGIENGQQFAYDVSNAMMASTMEGFAEKFAALADFSWQVIEDRRANPRGDYLSELAQAKRGDRLLNHEEIATMMVAFFTAGANTTAALIVSLLYEVFSRQAIKQQLLDDRSLIPAAVEEALRLHHPFFGIYRMTTHDIEAEGVQLPAGSSVMMSWQSANRDPAVFDDPTDFRLDRDFGKSVGFGYGIHSCIGAPLARMEVRVVLEEILARCPDMKLELDGPPRFEFHGNDTNSIITMPVSFPVIKT